MFSVKLMNQFAIKFSPMNLIDLMDQLRNPSKYGAFARPVIPAYVEQKWRALIESLWCEDPAERPSIDEVRTTINQYTKQ